MRRAYLATIDDRHLSPSRLDSIEAAVSEWGLRRVASTCDFRVFATPDLTVAMIGDRGAVVGRPLPNSSGSAPASLESAVDDGLSSRFWGDYVALTGADRMGAPSIERSVPGGLDAYVTTAASAPMVASHAPLLLAAAGLTPTIDWHSVAHHLAFSHLRVSRTGLAEIFAVMPGERVWFNEGAARRETLWSPWSFAGRDLEIAEPTEARRIVREAVIQAVHGVAGHCNAAALELSGGLDSSILAAAILTSGVKAEAYNLVTSSNEGDERVYARATAAFTGMTLHEEMVPDALDLTTPPSLLSPYPILPAWLGPADQLLAQRARERQLDGFISGNGGDSVFGSPASAAPAADVLRRFGPGVEFARAVRALAEIRSASVWKVVHLAVRQAIRPPIHRRWPRSPSLLLGDRIPEEPDFHPWLEEPLRALPGKRSHIRAIVGALAHVDGYARHEDAPMIFPLLSQPVLEACLRIPSWLHITGGRDRAIARGAFADRLPNLVLARRGKGRLDAYATRAFERNRSALKPYLLDGALGSAGIIDRSAVERFLHAPVKVDDPRFFELLGIIDSERWARSWMA